MWAFTAEQQVTGQAACSCINITANRLFVTQGSPPGCGHWVWPTLLRGRALQGGTGSASSQPFLGLACTPGPWQDPRSGSSTWGGRCQGCHVASMPAWSLEGASGTSATPGATQGSLATGLVGELLLLRSGARPGAELPGRVGHKFIPMSALALDRGDTERPIETCP